LKSVSLQYANALADIAMEQGAVEPAARQLGEFAAAYAESPELQNYLDSPAVSPEDKRAVLEKIAARIGASKMIRNFLFVVSDHRRSRDLPQIAEAFQSVVRERQGIADAKVFSSVPLSDGQKAELTKTLIGISGKTVEPSYFIEPELLGGVLVRVGDTIYDGSLRNRLAQMRVALAAD
jgi:F-type H+-transporting ATPase subunit delta